MRTAIMAIAAAALAGPLAADTNAADAIEPGAYVWTEENGCATLTVGDELAYVWDRGCDGSVDYRGRNVWSRGSVVHVDAATLSLRSVEAERLSGRWTLNDYSADVTFERR